MLPWPPVRAQPDTIPAPPFPRDLTWINVASLRMDKQRGRPVLVEFWDFCRVNSLRTLPYVRAWHERYEDDGLRVIGVHAGGFLPARDEANVRRAVERLGVALPRGRRRAARALGHLRQRGLARPLPVGRPGRAVLDALRRGRATGRPSARSRSCSASSATACAPLRPEDAPGALLPAQTEDQPGAYSGPYEAGGVWAVLDGAGEVIVNGRALAVTEPGCVALVEHAHHTAGVLDLAVGPGVDLPRHLLHAGGRSSAWPRSPSSRTSRGGPPSSRRTAVPGQ